MDIDRLANERITELEADLVAEGQRIDLLLESLYERDAYILRLEEAIKEFKLYHRSDLVA
jgi:hypothetical protein